MERVFRSRCHELLPRPRPLNPYPMGRPAWSIRIPTNCNRKAAPPLGDRVPGASQVSTSPVETNGVSFVPATSRLRGNWPATTFFFRLREWVRRSAPTVVPPSLAYQEAQTPHTATHPLRPRPAHGIMLLRRPASVLSGCGARRPVNVPIPAASGFVPTLCVTTAEGFGLSPTPAGIAPVGFDKMNSRKPAVSSPPAHSF